MSDAMIVAEALTRRYDKTEAVSDLTLAVGPREIFGLLGPNGAGKTTTLRVLVGALRPSSGTVRLGGIDVASDPLGARKLMGYVPDTPVLVEHLTGWEYLGLAADAHGLEESEARRRAEVLLERLDLVRVVSAHMETYSLGQRKKIALAVALLHQPAVLILDEPTASLDPTSTRQVEEILGEECARGAAVLLSTHLLQAAQATCHRVGLMNGGRLVALGTPAELVRQAAQRDPLCADLLAAYHVLMRS